MKTIKVYSKRKSALYCFIYFRRNRNSYRRKTSCIARNSNSKNLHISQRVISVIAVAIGTSLPELVTALSALKKKSGTLSAGNILGANIIDLTLILPLCSLISIARGSGELAVSASSVSMDMKICLIVICIAVLPTIITQKFQRWQGILLLLTYGGYIYFVVK